MKVELVPPQSVTEPRLWARPEQVLGMVLRPGSIEIGARRTDLTEFRYVAGEMILPYRHEGKWIGLMNAPYLQFSISDGALMAASDGEVELRMYRKFADPRLRALATAVHADNGGWVSKRAVVSGFCRTGDGRSPGQWSCVKPPSCADIPRRTRLGALAKD
jgi:hypothetical protein